MRAEQKIDQLIENNPYSNYPLSRGDALGSSLGQLPGEGSCQLCPGRRDGVGHGHVHECGRDEGN